MDGNKLVVLRDLGYSIQPTCSFCKHARFPSLTAWGTCIQVSYDHLKHTGPARELSIHRSGTCSMFEKNESQVRMLGAFAEFLAEKG
jgi:hypothetical protein